MRSFRVLVAALAIPLILGACSLTGPGVDGTFDDESFTKAKADEILGAVEGTEHRAARFALVGAAYSELAMERALLDPLAAQEIAGQMLRVERAVAGFSAGDADSIFPETDLRRLTLDLAEVVADVAVSRVRSLVENFAGGINIAGLRERARILAVQGALTDSLILDLRARVADLNNGTLTPEDAIAGAQARFEANQAKVEGLL